MNKNWLVFIVVFVLLVGDITLMILFRENQTQMITLIDPKPGIHVIEIPTNKKYVQLKIGNYSAGTLTISLETNYFKERKESK